MTTRTTAFAADQIVRSRTGLQGLHVGQTYVVIDAHERNTAFGNFVTYELAEFVSIDADGKINFGNEENRPTTTHFVKNGHLVLELVQA